MKTGPSEPEWVLEVSHKWPALARPDASSSVNRCNMVAWEVPTPNIHSDDYLRAKEYLVRLYPIA